MAKGLLHFLKNGGYLTETLGDKKVNPMYRQVIGVSVFVVEFGILEARRTCAKLRSIRGELCQMQISM